MIDLEYKDKNINLKQLSKKEVIKFIQDTLLNDVVRDYKITIKIIKSYS